MAEKIVKIVEIEEEEIEEIHRASQSKFTLIHVFIACLCGLQL